MVSIDLIEQFRDKVSQHNFVLFMYRNKDDKNLWSCICSAMDWITVGIEYIIDFNKSRKRIPSMEMYSYIASIDVVWEGIQQLHRVFCNPKELPFKNERICFNNRQFNEDDNKYFKTIRACFGAHPVNLDDPSNKDCKRFASWSGGHFGEGDYSVILYSSKPNEEYILLNIYFQEIEKFLERRYRYLEDLMQIIDKQYIEFKEKITKQCIQKEKNPLKQLYILKKEVEPRLDNELYESTIKRLIKLFEIEVTNESNIQMVNRYLDNLQPLIEEIYDNLDKCELKDLNDDILCQYRTLEGDARYWVNKLSEYMCGGGYAPSYWVDEISSLYCDRFIVEYSSYEELYLLVNAWLYQVNTVKNI